MSKKIQYHLRKAYNTLYEPNLYQQIADFLNEQGIPSVQVGGLLRHRRVKGATKNTPSMSVYGDVDLEVSIWSPEFLSRTEYLCFTINFDKNKDSLEQRKKVDNLVGLLAKYNPKNITTGKKEKEYYFSKECKAKNFWKEEDYYSFFSTMKDHLRQHDIVAREDFRSSKGRYIQGILGDIGIEVSLRRELIRGFIVYNVKFNDSLEERQKADNLIAMLAEYNPKYI